MANEVPRRRPNRRGIVLIAGAVVTLVGVGVYRYVTRPPGDVLPFTGINDTFFVAVDHAGNVYATEGRNGGRVLRLAAGSTAPTEVPFAGLHCVNFLCTPWGVAVDGAENVYVVTYDKIVKAPPGAASPTVVPDTGGGMSVAVDTAGNVYHSAMMGHAVYELAPGAGEAIPLPLPDVDEPVGVAVDTVGNVYVADDRTHRVLKLATGTHTETVLPFSGLESAWGVAVSPGGDVYVTDAIGHQVYKLAAGSTSATVLVPSLRGLKAPRGVAVDSAGNVYVTDGPRNRVYKVASR